MNPALQWGYDRRDAIAWSVALGLALVLTLPGWTVRSPRQAETEMSARLEIPAPPAHGPQRALTRAPSLETPRVGNPPPRPLAQPAPLSSLPARTDAGADSLVRAEAAAASPMPAAPDPAPAAAPAPRVAPPEPRQAQAGSAQYEGQILAYLEKIKRYPSSREARLTQPRGTVRLWLELTRTGELIGAGLIVSSGSNLLDSEALRTVRAGRFPAFPQHAFEGEASHRFSVGLKYQIED
jgi:protein TonB